MKIRAAIIEASDTLKKTGITECDNDAWMLFSYAANMNRTQYLLKADEEIDEALLIRYRNLIERRALREPLQYITGSAPFMGREFLVNDSVLIPRFDTENLVIEAQKYISEGMKVLDMCTGSGCIGLSLACDNSSCSFTLADISEPALEVARLNMNNLNCSNVNLINTDMFDNIDGIYDIIVSNPPYIPTKDIEELEEEVKNREPMSALDGSEDGLLFYKILASKSGKHLKNGGYLLLEIGYNQAEDVKTLLAENKFADIYVVKDLAGLDRVVCGRRK